MNRKQHKFGLVVAVSVAVDFMGAIVVAFTATTAACTVSTAVTVVTGTVAMAFVGPTFLELFTAAAIVIQAINTVVDMATAAMATRAAVSIVVTSTAVATD